MGRMFLNGEEYGVSSEDVSQSIVEFQSDDALEPKSSINLPLIEGRETIGGFAKKISKVVRNVRYLLHVLGTTDISLKGDGTVTGAIGALSEVAFTGDYRDLSEAPEVGAGTVTIKQGGQLAESFSVNQNQDVEIDLSVSQGPKGDDGVSVSKIEQVMTSTADGGTNVFRVTLSNGKTADFSVKNGSKGSTGAKGDKGDKGDTGARGATGPQGPAAGFGTPTASVDANVGTPSVTVTASGSNTAKVFNFVFRNLKGAKGDKGDKGDTGARGATGPQGPAGVNATTTAVATQSANGLQSAADKKKLDGIPADTKAQIDALNTGIDFSNKITVLDRFSKIRFKCIVKGKRVLMQGIFYGAASAINGQNHAIANISGDIKPSTQIDTIACIQDGNYHYLGSACLTVTANNIQVSSNISMAGRYVQFSVSYDL